MKHFVLDSHLLLETMVSSNTGMAQEKPLSLSLMAKSNHRLKDEASLHCTSKSSQKKQRDSKEIYQNTKVANFMSRITERHNFLLFFFPLTSLFS